ncbi:MAG: hypothetical protein ACR2GR_02715 [Rhodothermales bacterium]
MRRPLLYALMAGMLLTAGCASTTPSTSTQEEEAKKEEAPPARRADVLIEGDYRTTTPGTIQVRRGFGERYVALRVNGEVIRTFDVEQIYTSNRAEVTYFDLGTSLTFDVRNLPTKNDTLYAIPYYNHPIEVVDNEFGLTLIVSN